jgi:hypothetical protein
MKRVAGWNGEPAQPRPAKITKPRFNPKRVDDRLASAITSKLEAGHFRVAVRMLCTDDTPAPDSEETLRALEPKHPLAPINRRRASAPAGIPRFQTLQISPEDMEKSIRTFPLGSAGGPDGITPQHLWDLLAGAANVTLRGAITDFVNILLAGDLTTEIREIIFGGRLITLQKRMAESGLSQLNIPGEDWPLNVQTVPSYAEEARNLNRSRSA